MFGISGTVIIIGALILILLGLIIAFKGFDLLKDFVRTTGAVVVGILFFIIGGIVGLLFGPLMAILAAVAGGILGAIIGALLAPTLLWLLLSIIVFVICFNIGASAAGSFGASSIISIAVGIISGFLGSWIISNLARALLVGATSVVGGLLVGAGVYLILLGQLGFTIAAAAGVIALILISLAGYGANRKKSSGRKKRSERKKKSR